MCSFVNCGCVVGGAIVPEASFKKLEPMLMHG